MGAEKGALRAGTLDTDPVFGRYIWNYAGSALSARRVHVGALLGVGGVEWGVGGEGVDLLVGTGGRCDGACRRRNRHLATSLKSSGRMSIRSTNRNHVTPPIDRTNPDKSNK